MSTTRGNNMSTTTPARIRTLTAIVACLSAALVALSPAPQAHATSPTPPLVGAGLIIAGTPEPDQVVYCVLAGAGHDSTGQQLAFTAGHCAGLGSTVRAIDQTAELGTVIARRVPGTQVTEIDQLDYALIRLHPGVRVGPVPGSPIHPTRIGAPHLGEIACKYGPGVIFPGERCGVIDRVSAVEFDTFAFAIYGDSGSPVYNPSHTLIGILSRPWSVPMLSTTTVTRIDAAVRHARTSGALVGQFTPRA
ncbi:hypothetical protein ABLE94_02770 [Gordonia sp. VNK1]|jgi:hypothetical protein|uniref:hypothetical protein n=1 Tax=Gordonia oleivorans TaxID=3156618 RepID=UPI0032B4921B